VNGIGYAILWYFFSLIAAIACWPLLGRVLPTTVAWGVTRLVAVPLVAYLAVLPAAVAPVPFTAGRLWAAVGFLALVAWGAALFNRRFRVAVSLREFVTFEAVLLAGYVLFALLVPYFASVSGMGERMRDTALWTAIVTQQRFPFEEPWFAGSTVVYYVFGYATQAAAAVAWGHLEPLRSYNIALVQCAAWFVAASFLAFRAFRASVALSSVGAAASALGGNAYSAFFAAKSFLWGQPFNWWNPSRSIKNTITEFPIWTATLGDLHPHFLGMWIFPVLVAILAASKDQERPAWTLAVSAGALTALQHGTNTWELPVFVCLVLFVLAAKYWNCWKSIVGGVAVFFATVVVLSFPFARYSSKVSRSFGLVMERSDVWEWLGHWGLWFLPLIAVCFFRARKDLGRDLGAGLVLLAALALTFRSATVLMVLGAALVAYAFAAARIDAERRWVHGLWVYGLAVVLGCEFLHLKDVYGEQLARLNTVFKFYVPAWTAFAVPAVLLGADALRRLQRPWRFGLAGVWALALLAYPTVGLWARTHGFGGRQSLDGFDVLRREMADDVRMIQWMRQQRSAGRLEGKLLEGPGDAYSTWMRYASIVGMPALVAWEGYGYWSIQGLSDRAAERMALAKDVYAGTIPCDEVVRRLGKFGITHVVVGVRERRAYPADRLAYLQSCLTLVRSEGAASLYRL
jgi:YYY domain-containing protein